MYIVIAKLVDVSARAGFTVGAIYMLPLHEAGQFGVIATLVGLFAFAFGWERYIDIQRRMVGAPPEMFDAEVEGALRLSAFNYLVLLPVFVLITAQWADIGPWTLLLSAIIVISEQLSNMAYQFSLVERRYYPMLTAVAVKNIVAVLAMAIALVFFRRALTLDFVLTIWATTSIVATLLLAGLWIRTRRHLAPEMASRAKPRIFPQHKASLAHFGIGLLAILMLQFDRLTVGALLPFDESGVYFRHILLVSLVYQFFNIASYNRVLPSIFARSKAADLPGAQALVRQELVKVAGFVALIFAVLWIGDALTGGVWSSRFSISLALVGALLIGAAIRIAADFYGLVLNASMLEKTLLRQQIIAFGAGSLLLIGLTYLFGMAGTAAATIATSTLYLMLIGRAVRPLIKNQVE